MEKKIYEENLIKDAFLLSDLSESSYTKTYLMKNGEILKVFPKAFDQNKIFEANINKLIEISLKKENTIPVLLGTTNFSDYILANKDLMEKKILISKDFKGIEGIWLPKNLYYDHSGEFMAFSQDKVDGITLIEELDYMDERDICDKLIELTDIVKNANQNGIHITDLSNINNIMITNDEKLVLCDYNDFQIGDLLSDKISATLRPQNNPIFKIDKYYNKETGLYNSNLDKAALLNNFYGLIAPESLFGNNLSKRYQEAITNSRMRNFISAFEIGYLENMFQMASIENQDLKEATKLCFDLNQNNIYPDEAIKEYKKTL